MNAFVIELCLPTLKHEVVVGVVYRHTDGNTARFHDYLYAVLSKISLEGHYFYVNGDFNIDLCKSNSSENVHSIVACGFSPTVNKSDKQYS